MVVIERLVLVGNSDANMKFAFYVHPFANHARCVCRSHCVSSRCGSMRFRCRAISLIPNGFRDSMFGSSLCASG